MTRLGTNVDKACHYFTDDFNNPLITRVFFKGLVVFTLIKTALLWPLSQAVMEHHKLSLPRSWIGKMVLAPSFLANRNIELFLILAIVFLIFAVFLRPHYIVSILFFWLTVNLYVVFLPFANGADLILFMLALWCIPLAGKPTVKSEPASIIQRALHNLGVVLCQLQIVFIYLVSGWDKLGSETWRSGEAFDYIIHLNTLYNPMFTGFFENPFIQQVFSWATILFELLFVFLVWIEKTRLSILIAGIFFHLFIWVVMSLPDFAGIMIISYTIFLKDRDYARIRSWLKR